MYDIIYSYKEVYDPGWRFHKSKWYRRRKYLWWKIRRWRVWIQGILWILNQLPCTRNYTILRSIRLTVVRVRVRATMCSTRAFDFPPHHLTSCWYIWKRRLFFVEKKKRFTTRMHSVGCVPAAHWPYAAVLFPGQGGSAWSGGFSLVPGGGVCLVRGGSPWSGGGSPLVWGGFSRDTPPVNRITDTCKNITLATTSLRPVIILINWYISAWYSWLIIYGQCRTKHQRITIFYNYRPNTSSWWKTCDIWTGIKGHGYCKRTGKPALRRARQTWKGKYMF